MTALWLAPVVVAVLVDAQVLASKVAALVVLLAHGFGTLSRHRSLGPLKP